MEDKVRERNRQRDELNEKKLESLHRNAYIEDTLRNDEIRTTTPRSLRRRQIVRKMHIAMKRQEQQFMMCDWGCGDWFKVSIDYVIIIIIVQHTAIIIVDQLLIIIISIIIIIIII